MRFDEVWDLLCDWARGRVEGLEVFFLRREGLRIEKKDGRLETFQPFREAGLAVRVLRRQSLGFAYTSALSPEAVVEAAERALETAGVLEPDEASSFPGPAELPDVRPVAAPLLGAEELLARLERLEEAARGFDPRVRRLQEVAVREGQGEVCVANTLGVSLRWPLRSHSLVAVAVAEEGGEAQMGWEWRTVCTPGEIAPEAVGREAARRAVARLSARSMPSVRTRVLLPPHVAVDFLELLSEALCGDRVLKGKSPLAGKVGEEVFSPLVTIRDHGLREGGLETRPFDDEGAPQREKVLVRQGRLEGYLFDHYWGRKSGLGSTGNARRAGFKAPPGVGPTNLFLDPGPADPGDWRRERVFEVLEVLGMHTANPVSGDFSVGVAGLWHGGEEPRPVSGMALSGNVFSLFQRIEAVGRDLVFYGGLGAPSVLVAEMDLAGEGA